MDWSELNERFRKFDELCENLCNEFKINLNNGHQSSQLKVDISNHKANNLLSYTVLMPNQLKPITYTNITNQLLNELLNDRSFKNTGTLLRTLEKGVFHPVLHYSTIYNKNNKQDDDFIELFKSTRFGKDYTLYQAIYEELYTLDLPVVTKKVSKISKNSSTNSTIKNAIKHTINNNDEEDKFHSFDYSSTDSGCVSLNSTANDYSLDEQKLIDKSNLHNSMESLTSSYNSSNDSVLNSIDSQQHKDELNRNDHHSTKNLKNGLSNLMTNMISNNQLNYNLMSNFYNNLNDGHLIIGFRIKDEFFKRIFEQHWQEMSGARFLSRLVAAKFGLRRLKFLKRIALNTERQGKEFDDGTTFIYILHAEFLNLTNKNEIYLTNFVHRLRLRTLGSVTFYTNLPTN